MIPETRFLLLAVLSIYRITRLLTIDTILNRPRRWIRRNAAGTRWIQRCYAFLAVMLECPYCTGVWVALLTLPLLLYPSYLGNLWLLGWGLIGGQAFLVDLSRQGEGDL